MAKTTLFRNIGELLTLSGAAQKQGRHIIEADLCIQAKQAILVEDGQIKWIGQNNKIPRNFVSLRLKEIDLGNTTVVPGLIECHTHSVFSGDRTSEFEQKLNGVSYLDIAKKGGGILKTVTETRKAKPSKLTESLLQHVLDFASQGVTTLEIKSGYALDLKNELKTLTVIEGISKSRQGSKLPELISTYLGAHGLPPEFKSTSEYVDFIIQKVLPQIAKRKLSSRVDIFIEKNFFGIKDAQKLFVAAQKMGFETCVHADQLTLSGGTEVAIQFQSRSADHVIQLGDAEIQKLAKSDVTAVLLPVADLYMKCAYPKAREMIQAGVRVALATDFNPGTSPSKDTQLVGLLARLEMKMTLPQVICAYTVGAAHALNRHQSKGSLELGKQADFFGFNGEWTELFYSAGARVPDFIFRSGQEIIT